MSWEQGIVFLSVYMYLICSDGLPMNERDDGNANFI